MIDNREDNNYCLVRASHLDASEKEETQQQQQIIPKETKNSSPNCIPPSSEVFHHCQEKNKSVS